MLNPFRGVTNAIALDEADAVTSDGEHRKLYIKNCFDKPQALAPVINR